MQGYLWLFAEAEPGVGHELALAGGEFVLGVFGRGRGCHADGGFWSVVVLKRCVGLFGLT